MKKKEKFSIIYQGIEFLKSLRPFKTAIKSERNILVKKQYHFHDQRGEVDLPVNDTKNGQVRILSKFSQIVKFRAKIGPFNEIQNAIYNGIF